MHVFETGSVGSLNSRCFKCLRVSIRSQCVLIRVLAKQKVVAFETQVMQLDASGGASISENGGWNLARDSSARLWTLLVSLTNRLVFLVVWTEPMRI